MQTKQVTKDVAFHRIEFRPDEETAKRIGSPAYAYVSAADMERLGVGRSFTAATGLPYNAIVRVHEGLLDARGNRVELVPAGEGVR